jgi:hypothetical protein
MGVVHVNAHQLDRIGDVRLGEDEYWRAPVRLRQVVGLLIGAPMSEETLAQVSAGVVQRLQLLMPAHSRIS